MPVYAAFGLLIESEIDLPELRKIEAERSPSVVVRRGRLASFEGETVGGSWSHRAGANVVQFEVRGVGRFVVKGGSLIVFQAEGAATEDEIRLFVLGSGLGAVLLQRGLLALHGSVVVSEGSAVAFLGESGAGKSTLAAGLGRKGLPLLSDDLCIVSVEDGDLMVQPGYPQSKLWPDSLLKLEMEGEGLEPVRRGFEKRVVKVKEGRFFSEPCPLERVYVLSKSESGELETCALAGPAKMAALLGCRYRPQFAEGMGLAVSQFKQLAEVARSVRVDLLARPADRFAFDETVSLVATDLGLISSANAC